MKIVLVGASGSGKMRFAQALAVELESRVIRDPHHRICRARGDVAFGMLADYRIEAEVALARALDKNTHGIYKQSLIDSVAYITLKMEDLGESGADFRQVYRWAATGMFISNVADDTFTADYVFHLPGFKDDGIDFNSRIAERLIYTLDQTVPEYITLEGGLSDRVDAVKAVIQNEAGEDQ